MKAESLWRMTPAELAEVLRSGHAIEPAALAGASYRGVSLGLPGFIERLTWKTFRKSFHREPDGSVAGLNVRLVQEGVDAKPSPQRHADGREVTFGPFLVEPLGARRTPFDCAQGVVFDYGQRHHPLHPLARTRDVVVAIDEGGDLLLGALYLELGLGSLRTPSFFTLEREPAS